jgi:kynureninase
VVHDLIAELTERAAGLDAADPLGHWRDAFFVPDPDLAYLDGNSLGMPPQRTLQRVDEVMRGEWGTDLISSWRARWLELPMRVGDRLAPLIGAEPGEVIVHDSTTINLYQLIRAGLKLRPDRRVIAVDPSDFPTDRYVVDAIARADGLEVRAGFDDLDDVAVVVRSMVDYRTAEITDVATEARRAREAGALVVWDLSHAAGLTHVGVHEVGIELAVGCTYKFLNGGPGAPAFTYVARHLVEQIDEPFHGWFAETDQFAMGPEFRPRADIGRMLVGTPGILGLVAADCGIAVSADAGIDAIRAKSIELGRFGIECCDALGLTSSTPRDDARRGGHVCVHHPDAERIVATMATDRNVLADFRKPDVVRLGCSPLTTRFVDVVRATAAVAELGA